MNRGVRPPPGENGHANHSHEGARHGAVAPSSKRLPTQDLDSAAEVLRHEWESNSRWNGIRREHSAQDVIRLRGSVLIEHTLARRGAESLWHLVHERPYVPALGALTGGQAVQMVRAGVEAIYLSGWQVAADNNLAGETYPDLSLYPSNSVPALARRINKALLRADQAQLADGQVPQEWLAPIVADAEAGFGGPLNAYMLMSQMIEAGAAAVHFEDQLSTAKKCGHMGGKVLVSTMQHIRTLKAARLAADVSGVPSIIIARTDAQGAKLVASDIDERDREFLTGRRSAEGLYETRPGLEAAIARANAYAPYAEMLWFETHKPDLDEAREFAQAVHRRHPGKLLSYNLSPSFHWKEHMDAATVAQFQPELGKMGFKFQFVTLAGFHANSAAVYKLAKAYATEGMTAYVRLQEEEFAMQSQGYTAVRHQQEAGAGYFDHIARAIAPGDASTVALADSTEDSQFVKPIPQVAASTARTNGVVE